MLQTTSNVQVAESQLTDVRRSNGHTSELAMMLYLKVAVAPTALGTRVIWRVAGKTGNAFRAGRSDVRYQLELFGT